MSNPCKLLAPRLKNAIFMHHRGLENQCAAGFAISDAQSWAVPVTARFRIPGT
jgi:hypothetical protein